ncbi:MAG: metallophosphoesterase [Chloracidobacterium sp.]|nr:metallophosphoesterase [Chloracidobacterium sp.]
MKLFKQNLFDSNEYRYMVRWFSPLVLLKTLEKVLPSTFFARYADRRLVHAALDSRLNEENIIEERCGGEGGIRPDDKSEVWVDYVADLGDGFDSTYAVAYLVGRKSIEVDGVILPRADCLVMGGDQVYPDASRDDYRKRMQRPYRAAFPRTERPDAIHPPVFLIPGNHDWYDGLTLFLAMFCNGREDNYLGSWRASQRRSYFAVHLGMNWWLWGFDSQLDEDIDTPQSDYFHAVARKMKPNAKVIICASVPTWLGASLGEASRESQDRFYKGVDFVANIVCKECEGAKIPLVLSGDLHHYTRYVAKETGTHFITAGGGGAFLHPTHFLVKNEIRIKWSRTEQSLEIGQDQPDGESKKSIYPTRTVSRKLAWGNLKFSFTNWDFCVLVLGPLYSLCGVLMLAWNGYGQGDGTSSFSTRFWEQLVTLASTPMFMVVVFVLWLLLFKTADIASQGRKYIVGTLHSMAHIAVILFGTAFVSASVVNLKSIPVFGDDLYFFALLLGMVLIGFGGGFIWGSYLALASYCWGDEPNSAFSAMRLDNFRHFLRLKVEKDQLTIYPVGIDDAPKRSDWEMNENFDDDNPHQDTPAILPKSGHVRQRMIEAPIVIDCANIKPLLPL